MNADQIRWSHPSYYHFKNNSFGVGCKMVKVGFEILEIQKGTTLLKDDWKVIFDEAESPIPFVGALVDVANRIKVADPLADIW